MFAMLLSVLTVTAWPTAVFERALLAYNATDADIDSNLQRAYQSLRLNRRQTSFDPTAQLISTTGQYAFRPPNFDLGDVRGNCPGLNALANHGYIPHNGVATTAQFADACFKGMSDGSRHC